jgi:hypothetical protein
VTSIGIWVELLVFAWRLNRLNLEASVDDDDIWKLKQPKN